MFDLEHCKSCGKLALSGETVTISASEYQKLIQDAASGRSQKSISTYRALSRSGIGLNPELADFILEQAKTKTIAGIHTACVERFADKSPSRSSIFRFIDKMRKNGR